MGLSPPAGGELPRRAGSPPDAGGKPPAARWPSPHPLSEAPREPSSPPPRPAGHRARHVRGRTGLRHDHLARGVRRRPALVRRRLRAAVRRRRRPALPWPHGRRRPLRPALHLRAGDGTYLAALQRPGLDLPAAGRRGLGGRSRPLDRRPGQPSPGARRPTGVTGGIPSAGAAGALPGGKAPAAPFPASHPFRGRNSPVSAPLSPPTLLWRIAGGLAIAHVALLLGGMALEQSPALG